MTIRPDGCRWPEGRIGISRDILYSRYESGQVAEEAAVRVSSSSESGV